MITINLRSSFLIICFILIISELNSQTLSQSPYSNYGIGDLQFFGSSAFSSMGQVNQGLRRKYDLNALNPASYSALAQTNIEAGASYGIGKMQSKSVEKEVSLSGLNYFNIGTSISKRGIGIAFGAAPYSSIGFDVAKNSPIQTDTSGVILARTTQTGQGGINRAFIGLGAKIHKNVSVGANLAYIFGSIESRIIQTLPSQYYIFNWDVDQKKFLSGLMFDYGIQTHFDSVFIGIPSYKTVKDSNGFERKKWMFKKNNPISVVAGLTFNAETKIFTEEKYSFKTLSRGGVDFPRDSILVYDNLEGDVVMPFSIKYGIAFTNNVNWTIAADFGTTAWSNYSEFGTKKGLQDAWHFNVGASWLPDAKDIMRNYLKRLEYRVGFRSEQTNVIIENQSINLNAYSFGIGIPIAERGFKRFSKINLGFEYLTRGENINNLIKEEYFNFRIGIVFTDKWFIKYKYD